MRKNDLARHRRDQAVAANERESAGAQAKAMALAIEKFCFEHDISLLLGMSVYDRLDREERIIVRWVGPACTLVGLSVAMRSCSNVELGDALEDLADGMPGDEDPEEGGGVP